MQNNTAIQQNLFTLKSTLQTTPLSQLFAIDPDRAKNYSITAAGLFLDYSKNLIDKEILDQLFQLAIAAELPDKIHNLFVGNLVNVTENRPARHTELRQPLSHAKPEIAAVRQRLQQLSETIDAGIKQGFSGLPFTDVVNIGIGGSDLGPKLVCEALKPYQSNTINFHFISNVDGYSLEQLLKNLNPETTLFIIASKSFTTVETLLNLETAKKWLHAAANSNTAWMDHCVAATANPAKATAMGFKTENIFPFWDWVGGRYSLWSAVGLSIALCIGANNFERLLAGAHAMDNHYKNSQFQENMPVILALLEIWYTNFWNAETQAIIPYADQLKSLPSYLQQLVMESNGKRVSRTGELLSYKTSPIIWGEAGTNCQHSFMQLLHQSERLIPVDFIAVLKSSSVQLNHKQLLANCFSQARVLMIGKDHITAVAELIAAGFTESAASELAPHKILPGNHPSNMLLLESLSPESLGALIALYEHKVYTSAMLWQINPFDQWGVEMGKQVVTVMLPKMEENELCLEDEYDSSTVQLIRLYRDNNNDKT